jgi:SPP1 family predicted phage head-tail adaptor
VVPLVRAGLLNRRIQLRRHVETINEKSGERLGEWVPYAHVWAQVVPLAVREQFSADQVVEHIDLIFRIHWRRDVEAQHRVVYEGRAYDIVGMPQPLGDRDGLELRCAARAEG